MTLLSRGCGLAAGGRLSADQRRGQIVAAARRLLVAQGFLPLPPERLADEIGVSKALIYNHFPDQHDLFNTVVDEEFGLLAAAGIERASRLETLGKAAPACAELYFQHICEHGPAIHVILRDHFMAGRLNPQAARLRDLVALRLGRLARRELGLTPREAVAAIGIGLAIPEEAGRLVWQGELAAETGLELCRRLTLAAIAGLGELSSAGPA